MKLFCHVLTLTVPTIIALLLVLFSTFTEWWSYTDYAKARRSFVNDTNNRHLVKKQIRYKFTKLDGLFGTCYNYKYINILEPLKAVEIFFPASKNNVITNKCDCSCKNHCCETLSEEQLNECFNHIVYTRYDTQWYDELNDCHRIKYNYMQIIKDMFSRGDDVVNTQRSKRQMGTNFDDYDEPNNEEDKGVLFDGVNMTTTIEDTSTETEVIQKTETTVIANTTPLIITILLPQETTSNLIVSDSTHETRTMSETTTTTESTITTTETKNINTTTVMIDEEVPVEDYYNFIDNSTDVEVIDSNEYNGDHVEEVTITNKEEIPLLIEETTTTVQADLEKSNIIDVPILIEETTVPDELETPKTKQVKTENGVVTKNQLNENLNETSKFEFKILKLNLLILLNLLICIVFTFFCFLSIIFVRCCNHKKDSVACDKYEYYDNVHNYKYAYRHSSKHHRHDDNDDEDCDDDDDDLNSKMSCCKCTYILCPFMFYSMFTFITFISSLFAICVHFYKLYLVRNHYMDDQMYQLNTWLIDCFKLSYSLFSLLVACLIYFFIFFISTCFTCRIQMSPQWRSRYSDVYEVLQMSDVQASTSGTAASKNKVKKVVKQQKIVRT